MTCQRELLAAGKPYPRTCSVCGLGPCQTHQKRAKRIYLAGKMRGVPEFNKAAFEAAAAALRTAGHEVFSPVEHTMSLYGDIYTGNLTGDESLTPIVGRVVFKADLNYICDHADAVALLPGWETSKGAIAERATAEALGLEIIILS